MRYPRAIAAGLIDAFDGDAGLVEPQCHGTAPPRTDPNDDRPHRAAAKAGRHPADARVDPAAFNRQRRFAGDDRNSATTCGIPAQLSGAVEPAPCFLSALRPIREPRARLLSP